MPLFMPEDEVACVAPSVVAEKAHEFIRKLLASSTSHDGLVQQYKNISEDWAGKFGELEGFIKVLEIDRDAEVERLKMAMSEMELLKNKDVQNIATNSSLKRSLDHVMKVKDQFVVANFDSAPTADSEFFGKLNPSIRDEYESRAILKSYVVAGADSANPEKFLAYMVPSLDEVDMPLHELFSITKS